MAGAPGSHAFRQTIQAPGFGGVVQPETDRAMSGLIRRGMDWYRQRGWRWLFRRARQEWQSPKFGVTRAFRRARMAVRADQAGDSHQGDRDAHSLFFFFDLQLCPLAFDIATYMAAAELERRRLGLHSVHIVVVPGNEDGLRLELPAYDAAVNADARRWRLHNLVLPVTSLLPSCSGMTVCASRAEAASLYQARVCHAFPSGWTPAVPAAPLARVVRDAARAGTPVFPLLTAPPQALRYAEQFLAAHASGRRAVVITLRQYAYTEARNSDIDAWIMFANRLDRARFAPIFVLDTDRALDSLPAALSGHIVAHAAPWNVHFRMALYQCAFVNMGVVHGPMELCWYNEACSYVMFCPVNTAPLTGTAVLQKEGFEIGKSLPFARPWQVWIWEADHLEAIERAFAAAMPRIESRAKDKT